MRLGEARDEDATQLGQLSERDSLHGDIDVAGADAQELIGALERMMLVRRVEEIIADNVKTGVIRCPCHLAIGQEACAVGVAAALRPTDRVFGAHRSHAHFIALGGSVHGLFAEVLGRETGVSKGMGGSMHLVDRSIGLFGTVPIVGATIPIAVGAGLAALRDGTGDCAVTFFGDGATEEGGFHESMNLATMLKAPVLFVCENNFFSSHLHIDLRQPYQRTSRHAVAHGVPHICLDGNDVVAVAKATRSLVDAMRNGGGPAFLELVTYRWRGHVGWRDDEDVGVARGTDLRIWRQRDPIARLASGLQNAGLLTAGDHDEMVERVEQSATSAWAQALEDPYPSEEALLERVYVQSKGPAKVMS